MDDTPWACVSCSRCEEMCPMNVMPFEMILAIRQWQCRNDETLVPPSIVEIYKRGYTQAVGVNTELRESLGLNPLPTITNNPEQLEMFQEMLMKTHDRQRQRLHVQRIKIPLKNDGRRL